MCTNDRLELCHQFLIGLDHYYPDDLPEKLVQKKSLRVKFGADPSASDLHFGHLVVLNKLRILQKMGHQIIFLIGDFTARIGDPTGKSETRPPLTEEQVRSHAKTYQDQVFKILDPEKTTVVYNSDWLSSMTPSDMIQLSSRYTVARMLERDDFEKRYRSQQAIGIHEFLYPLLQGYDSVHLQADLEMGGRDQLFNLLMGRSLQKDYQVNPQGIATVPILEGLDGQQKMSKSLQNHISILDTPSDKFGKLMSISDTLISRYLTLLTDATPQEIESVETAISQNQANPRDLKIMMAKRIISQLDSKEDADTAEKEFLSVFSGQGIPEDIPTVSLHTDLPLIDLIVKEGLAPSKKEARRLFDANAISVDGEKIQDPFFIVSHEKESIIKVGKRRWIKVCTS